MEVVDRILIGRRPGKADAVRDAADGVERVDERESTRVGVKRVCPAPVERRCAVDGPALHDPALLRLVGYAAAQQGLRVQVVRAHDVVLDVLCRRVLDQIEPRRVW